ncbi:MAG TPA: SRPBCC family protein [Candidatus Dormibacteraeota bacterium]|jgi:uncharacterized protein YndB with AHSA1/START domain|nr:SRPBCC family protein [Candidatus Dormibacteraeota bacterium]
MEINRATHATIILERKFPVPPERVFAAFSDPAKKRKWFADGEGAKIESYELDFRVGGKEVTRMHFPDFPACTNDTYFLVIVPNHRIVIAYTMTMNDHAFSSSQTTFELIPSENGTTLVFTEQAAFFEKSDGPKLREDGWRQLFDQLARTLAN